MRIKAQALLNAVRFVRERWGDDTLGAVLLGVSPETRASAETAIAINWHPMHEFVEFLEAVERQLGTGDGSLAVEIGAAGARANLGRPLIKAAFFVARPKTLMNRIATAWRKYNDEGEMRVLSFERQRIVVEVRGLASPHRFFCESISGWMREVGLAFRVGKPTVSHVECRGRGDARCVWQAQFAEPVP